jgi:hypothetical protein
MITQMRQTRVRADITSASAISVYPAMDIRANRTRVQSYWRTGTGIGSSEGKGEEEGDGLVLIG